MRHHHPQRPARGGIPPAPDVEKPQRHHPRRAGRHRVPRPHRGGYGDVPTAGTRLEATYHHRAARLRRRVQVHRVPCPRRRARELVFTDRSGQQTFRATVSDYDGPGVLQGSFNKDDSIRSFAHACFGFALSVRRDLWFSTKDTISKKYDHTFKDIFQEIYDRDYKEAFEKAGIEYFYTLIDDAVARVIRSEGGYIWACKNYDGDVMSDMVATAFGSLAMMTSVLVSPNGCYEYEAAHGTVQRHYYQYKEGKKTSTNPVATIFAWTGALRKRGELDGNQELMDFADRLEKATIDTIEEGYMTKDLAMITTLPEVHVLNSEGFIKAIAERL